MNKVINPDKITYQDLAIALKHPEGVLRYPDSKYEEVLKFARFVSSGVETEVNESEDHIGTDTVLLTINTIPRYLEARLYLPDSVCDKHSVGIPILFN